MFTAYCFSVFPVLTDELSYLRLTHELSNLPPAPCWSPVAVGVKSFRILRVPLFIRTITDFRDCSVVTSSMVQTPVTAAPSQRNIPRPTNSPPPKPPTTGAQPSSVLYDLSIDGDGKLAVTVGQDGILRLYDVEFGTAAGVIRQALERDDGGQGGEAVRVSLDPSGTLAVCACADGSVALYDLLGGCVAARSAGGHGDAATGIVITDDCSRYERVSVMLG